MRLSFGATSLSVVQGDITDQEVDAVVNAANSTLMGGGGVDGAIHMRGGPAILEECERIRRESWPGGLPRGRAVITGAGRLKAKHVIHTVGPVWTGGGQGEAKTLADCYASSLEIVKARRLRSVAFPAISTGVYGYPPQEAAAVALRSVKEFAEKERWPPFVSFVLFGDASMRAFVEAAVKLGLA